jgi:hypothetical protein
MGLAICWARQQRLLCCFVTCFIFFLSLLWISRDPQAFVWSTVAGNEDDIFYFLSYPKSGRTWLRWMVGCALTEEALRRDQISKVPRMSDLLDGNFARGNGKQVGFFFVLPNDRFQLSVLSTSCRIHRTCSCITSVVPILFYQHQKR